MLNISDDMSTLFDAFDREKLSEDQILNMLIGMKELHTQRHHKLWCTFEKVTKVYHQTLKANNLREAEEQLLNEDIRDDA